MSTEPARRSWRVADNGAGVVYVKDAADRYICHVCRLEDGIDNDARRQEHDEHARLIAAAPDLLASLQRCAPWLGVLIAEGAHERSAMPQDAVMALAEAQAIIEKAGGTP